MPDYLKEVPEDPFSGRELGYDAGGKPPMLFSVGQDGRREAVPSSEESDDQSGAESPPTEPGTEDGELMQKHRQITQEGILADFMDAVSAEEYERAFGMLQEDLRQQWSRERFKHDWQKIKKQLGERWETEPTGSFSGRGSRGPYEQATYRLESDWEAFSSVNLVAMQVEGKLSIINVQIRVPPLGEPPAEIQAVKEKFVESMIARDFESVTDLLAPSAKGKYPEQLLQQLASVLGDSAEDVSAEHYRICADGTWYQAVRLVPADDAATFVEVIMLTEQGAARIEGLSFKGRMGR